MGISLIALSIYLATIPDATDPVLAFIRAYSQIHGDQFQYFKVLIIFIHSFKILYISNRLKVILILMIIGVLYMIAVIAYCSGYFGPSIGVTMIVNTFTIEF